MLNWLNRLLADPQGIPDDGRVMAFIFGLTFVVLGVADVFYLKHAFDPVQFGIGSGGMASFFGLMFKWRGKE
jgi:hypothetical protein